VRIDVRIKLLDALKPTAILIVPRAIHHAPA
jgi:hypothetical protein